MILHACQKDKRIKEHGGPTHLTTVRSPQEQEHCLLTENWKLPPTHGNGILIINSTTVIATVRESI